MQSLHCILYKWTEPNLAAMQHKGNRGIVYEVLLLTSGGDGGFVYGRSVEIKYINLFQRNKSQTTTWNTAPKQPLTSLDEIKVQYKEIFEGISTFLGKPYHINTDPSMPPKQLLC